jgi:hypothetical protein
LLPWAEVSEKAGSLGAVSNFQSERELGQATKLQKKLTIRIVQPSYRPLASVTARLKQVGIRPKDIVIWDHSKKELRRVGFHLSNDTNRERIVGSAAKDLCYEVHPSSRLGSHSRTNG